MFIDEKNLEQHQIPRGLHNKHAGHFTEKRSYHPFGVYRRVRKFKIKSQFLNLLSIHLILYKQEEM
jgi:hypothetical protein